MLALRTASPPLYGEPAMVIGEPCTNDDDIVLCVRLLKERAGLVLGPHKRDMVARVLGIRARVTGAGNVSQYLARLRQNGDWAEWEHFVNAFTINHTAFFRE